MKEETRHRHAFPQMPGRDSRAALVMTYSGQLAMCGLFVIALLAALETAFIVLAPIFLGITVSLVVGPVATRMEDAGIPAGLSAGIMTLVVVGAGAGFIAGIVVPITEWVERTPDIWQRLERLVWTLQGHLRDIEDAAENISEAIGAESGPGQAIDPIRSLLPALGLAPALLAQIVIFVGTVYFFLATRHQIRDFVLTFCLSRRARWRVARIFRDIEGGMSRYFGTIAVINVGFGIAVGTLAWSFGMPTPYVWGGLAAGLNFLPYVGPAIMAMILFSIGLLVFEAPGIAVLLMLGFILLNLMEGQFITPSIVGRTLLLNPFLVFCAISFFLWLWGAPGAFLAVPFLLSAKVILYHLRPGRKRGRGRDLAPHRPA